jgi:uncharacterized Zn-binding protein involved in type VI secretion
MSTPTTRIGDLTSHGGVIITGSDNCRADGIPVSRIADLHACPIHGVNVIVTGSPNHRVNSRDTSRIGSLCACGAVVITGSPGFSVE